MSKAVDKVIAERLARRFWVITHGMPLAGCRATLSDAQELAASLRRATGRDVFVLDTATGDVETFAVPEHQPEVKL